MDLIVGYEYDQIYRLPSLTTRKDHPIMNHVISRFIPLDSENMIFYGIINKKSDPKSSPVISLCGRNKGGDARLILQSVARWKVQ
jgi:hypothetical protein